ncbi:MAG: CheR family methyltransferase, partial [Salinigranum sp.]
MAEATAGDPDFERLLAYIERSLGFATSSYNDAYLDRRISSRIRRTGAGGYDAYRRLLSGDDAEQAALMDALSVNVTSFFRNPDVWEVLREVLADLSDGSRTRVWSAACSDGREAYSLAMLALDDPRVDADALEVTATDIKPSIVADAREGVYRASETNDLDTQLS